ncbi:MAG: Mur ligase family protein [Candidatus Saccharimonadales bacterium]
MLQTTEYRTKDYFFWLIRTKDFSKVTNRRSLEQTKAAKGLLLGVYGGILLQILIGICLIYLGAKHSLVGGIPFGIALILSYPLVWPFLLVIPLELGRAFVIEPAKEKAITKSKKQFEDHKAIKIAVAGSYGKTTMKELLNTVLSQGLKVAATPANKNVSSSHAKFVSKLSGNEDVLIIEYGEGEPGDIEKFVNITKPTHGIITGLSPAHLDQYKTLEAAGKDIFTLGEYLKGKNVYVNGDSGETKSFIKKDYDVFNHDKALGWDVSKVKVDYDGTSFVMKKGDRKLELHSQLIGKHQVGFLAFVSAFALSLGLSEEQVIEGVAKTKPFEHRMQPYKLSGAWIIDDTYNGNLEGIRAGTQLLKDLDAKRKLYVTPGLVDQGEETERVHIEVGKLVAQSKPDVVVLMKNSVTDFIKKGLNNEKFSGQLLIQDNPLDFYTNLSHFVAAGDLVVMQNDWTDNYA